MKDERGKKYIFQAVFAVSKCAGLVFARFVEDAFRAINGITGSASLLGNVEALLARLLSDVAGTLELEEAVFTDQGVATSTFAHGVAGARGAARDRLVYFDVCEDGISFLVLI
jgi:hypothetical protein